MFIRNVGLWDRVIRVVVGLALISGFWLLPEASWNWAFWIGAIPLVSGLVGHCPSYRLLSWNTARDHDGPASA